MRWTRKSRYPRDKWKHIPEPPEDTCPQHLFLIVYQRRFRHLWAKTFWTICTQCDYRKGPFISDVHARSHIKVQNNLTKAIVTVVTYPHTPLDPMKIQTNGSPPSTRERREARDYLRKVVAELEAGGE